MIRVLAGRAEFTSGDTVTLETAMTRDGSRFFPADAYNLLFTAKLSRDDTDEEAVIQKYTGVGITVTNDKAYVELVNVDTEEQQDVMLFCDIRAINIETGDRHKVADWELTLNKPVTQGTVPSVPIHTTNPAEFNGDLTSGPVTSSGGVSSIADGAITNAMLANGAVANLSGANTGDQTTITGNAGTATALQTARTINGVSFDGTTNITVTAAAGTLTGTTLASNVTTSSLTSVGTIATGTWNASVIAGQYGGTGVNNSGKTITLGASLITTGTDIPTFAFPSSATARTYTFPTTSATLARTDSGQEFVGNQSIVGTLQVNETSGTAITANSLFGNQADFGGGKFLIQNNGTIISNVIGGLPFASQVELTSQSLLTGNSAVTRALGDARYLQPTVATKTTPVDADTVELQDSVASGARKLLSFANLWVWIKAYLDTALTIAGAKTWTGQQQLTGQAATDVNSAMTRGHTMIETARMVTRINVDPATWQATVVGAGSAIITPNDGIHIRTGVVAGSVLARNNGNGVGALLNQGGNGAYGTARWGEPWEISFRFILQGSDAAFVRRILFGTPYNNTVVGDLSNRGVGIKIENLDLKLQTHNGTTLTNSASLATLQVDRVYHVRLSLDGAGGIIIYVDGAQVGSATTAPSTFSSHLHNGIEITTDNGGATVLSHISVQSISYFKQ